MKKQVIIISSIIVGLIAIVWCGFLSKPERHIITRIETKSETYFEAEYSEYSCQLEIDSEGSLYTDCDTDYWSEIISETHTIETEYSDMGFVYLKYYPVLPEQEGVFFSPVTPERFNDYPSTNLDGTYLREDITVKCWYEVGLESEDYNTIKFEEYSKYQNMIGDTVLVNTWYGIRTGLD